MFIHMLLEIVLSFQSNINILKALVLSLSFFFVYMQLKD